MREDLEIRRALWASHPCEGKYHDNGEFQCGYYLPIIDFLRDDWETLGRRIARHTQAMLREQQRGFRDEVEKLVRIDYGQYYSMCDATAAQLAHDKETLLKKLKGQ